MGRKSHKSILTIKPTPNAKNCEPYYMCKKQSINADNKKGDKNGNNKKSECAES